MKDNNIQRLSETITLMEVLKILRDEKSRNARKIIYETYLDSIKKNTAFSSNVKIQQQVDNIKGDFDEIGFLLEYGYLNEFPFFELYSDVICRLWKILKEDIKKERIQRQNNKKNVGDAEEFLQFFEKLAIRAQRYREKNGLTEPAITDLRYNVENL